MVRDGVLFGLSHLNSGQYFALDLELRGGALGERAAPGGKCRAGAGRRHRVFAGGTTPSSWSSKPGGRGLEEVRRYEVAESETWAQPTVSGGRIYVKDVSRLYRWDIR